MKRITEASAELGVSPTTLRRWTRAGLVPVVRTPRNRWYWTKAMLEEIRQGMGNPSGSMAGAAVATEA